MSTEKTSAEIARIAAKVLRGEFNQPSVVYGNDEVGVTVEEYNELLFIAQALAGSCLTQAANRGINNKQEKKRGKKATGRRGSAAR